MSTVAELIDEALTAVSEKSRPTYGTGIRLLGQELGERPLAAVHLADLEALRDRVRRDVGIATVARARRSGRRLASYDPDAYGKGAAENFVRATRFFFAYACRAELLASSPAEH